MVVIHSKHTLSTPFFGRRCDHVNVRRGGRTAVGNRQRQRVDGTHNKLGASSPTHWPVISVRRRQHLTSSHVFTTGANSAWVFDCWQLCSVALPLSSVGVVRPSRQCVISCVFFAATSSALRARRVHTGAHYYRSTIMSVNHLCYSPTADRNRFCPLLCPCSNSQQLSAGDAQVPVA